MKKIFTEIKNFFLDLLFPVECLACGKEGKWLCRECFLEIKINEQFFCPGCGNLSFLGKVCLKCQREFYFQGLIVVSDYENLILREAIHLFKYSLVKDLGRDLSLLLGECLEKIKSDFLKEGIWAIGKEKEIKRILQPSFFSKKFL
ncbi:MAG TPA: hypothetical protein EYP33_03630, partial [Pyrodictium sp.]|nr:hypothetical protein [Pyrodictium sp.]